MGERSREEMEARDQLEAATGQDPDGGADIETLAGLYQCVRDLVAETEGWRRENDRHRALYVEAVKERDRLQAGIQHAEVHGELIVRMRESVWREFEAERDRLRAVAKAVLAGVDLEGNDAGRDVPIPVNRLADLAFALDVSPVIGGMTANEAYEFYADPGNQEPAGPPVRREDEAREAVLESLQRGIADAAAGLVQSHGDFVQYLEDDLVEQERQRIWAAINAWEERGFRFTDEGGVEATDFTHKPLDPFLDELRAMVFDNETPKRRLLRDYAADQALWQRINQFADEVGGIDGNVIRGWLDTTVREALGFTDSTAQGGSVVVMCTSGDHEDVPAVGDALTEEPDENRYPYCADCLWLLGPEYQPRLWADHVPTIGDHVRVGSSDERYLNRRGTVVGVYRETVAGYPTVDVTLEGGPTLLLPAHAVRVETREVREVIDAAFELVDAHIEGESEREADAWVAIGSALANLGRPDDPVDGVSDRSGPA